VTDVEVVRPELAPPPPPTLTVAKLEAVRDLLAPGLDDAELALFADVCNHSKLDPFSRQIWAYKRPKLTIHASIDGLRLIALRTGLYGGQLAAKWCGPDRQWVDVWLERDNPPAAAMKAVFRKDYDAPTVAVAVFDSYAQRKDGKLTGVWATGPEVMIAKCAEALALRQAFPAEMAGLYVEGEIPTDDPVPVTTAQATPDPRISGDEAGFLRSAILALSDQANTWLTSTAIADDIPNIDGPTFRRSHRDRLAWHIVVAQRIKPAAPVDEPTPAAVHDDAPETTPNNIDESA
jgi:phage recombination protein Bet